MKLTLASSPHVHSRNSTAVLMRDVCIALLPALVWAIIWFGWRCLRTTVFSAAACAALEWAYRRLMKKDCTAGDWSAVVTGVLLAFVCPADIPYWMLLLGDAFAIVLVKQLFGGIGMNIVNPALAARAFLMFGWPTRMSGAVYALPDALSSATPMQALHASGLPADVSLLDAFLGRIGGCIGEVSALMLLLAAHPAGLSAHGRGACVRFPARERPPRLDGVAALLRRSAARRVLHGHGLHYLARDPWRADCLRHRLRRGDDSDPLFRLLCRGRELRHSRDELLRRLL